MVENISGKDAVFDFNTARNYWKYAPSGKGKCNTADLLALSDEAFLTRWEEHFQSRLTHYWEDRHMVEWFSKLFQGARVLSFGSGIGHNEIQFLASGAHVTCADIVQSNLDVIQRVCRLKGLKDVSLLYMEDSSNTDFGEPYDHIFVRGSLMTMPEALQAKAMENFKKALKPGGMIILNLYTWEFVRQTCNVDDPIAFAKASDPSVGQIHNPWSDWHDDEKLLELAGDGVRIACRQFWNQGQYVWYALVKDGAEEQDRPVREFLDLNAREDALYNEVLNVPLSEMVQYESRCSEGDGFLKVETLENASLYAVGTGVLLGTDVHGASKISLDISLDEGALSLSVLDVEKQKMVYSSVISLPGRHVHYFRLNEEGLPTQYEIIISNHRPESPGVSNCVLHSLRLWRDKG